MAKGYEITSVRQATYRLMGGQAEVRYTVSIMTDKGSTGSLTIRASEFNKETVEEQLAELAETLDMPYSL